VLCSAQTGHATSAAVWHLGLEMPSAAIPPNSYSSSLQLAQLLSGVVNQRQRQTNKTDPTDRRRTVHNALQQPTLKRTLLHCASSPTIHTHTRLTALCTGLPRRAGTRKVQETVSGSGVSWAIMQVCTLLQTDNRANTPPLSFYRPVALPATQPTAS